MGEAADALLDGEQCLICGEFFDNDAGFPCVHEVCWNELDEADKKNFSKHPEGE